jgi:hypothetical protein
MGNGMKLRSVLCFYFVFVKHFSSFLTLSTLLLDFYFYWNLALRHTTFLSQYQWEYIECICEFPVYLWYKINVFKSVLFITRGFTFLVNRSADMQMDVFIWWVELTVPSKWTYRIHHITVISLPFRLTDCKGTRDKINRFKYCIILRKFFVRKPKYCPVMYTGILIHMHSFLIICNERVLQNFLCKAR